MAALHREDAIGPDQLPRRRCAPLQLRDEIIHIAVPIHCGRALRDRLGEANRVDDRRMVERIRGDEVTFAQDAWCERLVGVPGGQKRERRLGADESGERRLERAVDGEGATNEPDARRARSVAPKAAIPASITVGSAQSPR